MYAKNFLPEKKYQLNDEYDFLVAQADTLYRKTYSQFLKLGVKPRVNVWIEWRCHTLWKHVRKQFFLTQKP